MKDEVEYNSSSFLTLCNKALNMVSDWKSLRKNELFFDPNYIPETKKDQLDLNRQRFEDILLKSKSEILKEPDDIELFQSGFKGKHFTMSLIMSG